MQKFLRKIVSGVLAGGVFLCCGMSPVSAENTPFNITEIHPEEEFIEIENVSDQSISLSGWKYSEETGSGIEKKYEFPAQNNEVLPGNFFVIELSRKINNSGDVVKIYNPEAEKISEVHIPASISGKSYSLRDGIWSWENPTKGENNVSSESDSESEGAEISGTKTEETEQHREEYTEVTSSSSEDFDDIVISEILPNPVGTDSQSEFIELFNASENAVSLENFFLEDLSGKKYQLIQLSESQKILPAKNFLALPYSQTKITINNSDEKIFLKTQSGQIVSQVEFSESREGESFSEFSGEYKWTATPTEGSENILTVSQDSVSSSSSGVSDASTVEEGVMLFDHIDNSVHVARAQGYAVTKQDGNILDLKIQKIFPASRPDTIDILCAKCNASLEGVRLGVDGEVFRIPEISGNGEKILGKTGDILSFEFQNISASEKKKRAKISEPLDSARGPEKTEQGWKFYVPVSGLTATDETVYIGNKDGKLLDAVFYSNKNRYFQKSEQEVLGEIIARKEWGKYAREFSGVSTVAFSSQSFLKRENGVDTNTKDDFFRGFLTDDVDFSYKKSQEKFLLDSTSDSFFPDLKFSELYFFPSSQKNELEHRQKIYGYVKFYIQNKGNTPLSLSDYFLSNKEKFLVRLDEEQKILFPNQKILIQIPEKKFSHNDVFLEIRDRKDRILDVFCLNSSKKSGKYRSSRYHQHLLKSPLKKNCLVSSLKNNKKNKNNKEEKVEKILFIRHDFSNPFSPEMYTQNFSLKNPLPEISKKVEKKEETFLFPDAEKIVPMLSTAEIERKKEQESLQKKEMLQKKFPIRFSRVLPNPKGKDSGNEKIFLRNTSENFVWLRNFSLKTTGRKNGKKLPMMYFYPHEEKEIQFFSGFTLKNSGENLSLLTNEKIALDEISWKKAREGEFFGASAPRYIPKIKKSKKSKISQKDLQKKLDSIVERKLSVGEKLPNVAFKTPENFSFFQNLSFLEILLFFLIFSGIFSGIGVFLWRKSLLDFEKQVV